MDDSIKPNILFLLIDSFRADKCYGKEKTSVTPNLDSLIEKGTYFTQAISSAPVTIPAISSIMTGRYPFKAIISGGNRFKLNSNIPTFISHLKTSDYYTIAITPKILSLSGLTNDFEDVIEYPGHDGLYDGVGKTILTVFEDKKLKNPWFFYAHLVDIHGTPVEKSSEMGERPPPRFRAFAFSHSLERKCLNAVSRKARNRPCCGSASAR